MEERYTRPQGLYPHPDIDLKRLRRLILEAKLAPCYPGSDNPRADLDECPICFLFYPSLNRSKCCAKGICTECFLQMKSPTSCRSTQCPYCKMVSNTVEYRGVKTKEEKGIEQLEEQRVIEAQIRRRQQELQDDAERMKKKQTAALTDAITTAQGILQIIHPPFPSTTGRLLRSSPNRRESTKIAARVRGDASIGAPPAPPLHRTSPPPAPWVAPPWTSGNRHLLAWPQALLPGLGCLPSALLVLSSWRRRKCRGQPTGAEPSLRWPLRRPWRF